MKRFDAIKKIVQFLEDEIIVCNLGAPSRELYNIKDRDQNFYMLGSMGLCSSIAFGIALSRPKKKVISLDGDGSILMNMGGLSTIANYNPRNLTLIVIDNSSYGSTGDQKTYTGNKTKLEKIAEGAGFESIIVIGKEQQIRQILESEQKNCRFVLIKTKSGNARVENIPLSPEEIKNRFREMINSKNKIDC